MNSNNVELLNEYDANLSTIKSGAIVCYVIRDIDDNSNFTSIGSEKMLFSWGEATVRFYKRK